MSTNSSHNSSIASELFSLKWRKHAEMFCCMQAHRMKGQFCDLQLVCESMRFPAHRLVLASCSDYFAQMLQETPGDSTVVVLNNASAKAVSRLLDFMYQGEVNVPQSELQSLLSTAECLQIKGLMQSDKAPSHRSPSPLPEAAGSPIHKRTKVRAISRSPPPPSPPPLHHPSSRSASPMPTPLTNNTSSINNNNNDDTKHFQSWLNSRSSSSPDVSTNNTNLLNHHHLQQQQKHNLLQLRQHQLSQQQQHHQQQPHPSSVLSSIRNYSENRSSCHPSSLSNTVATTAALTSLITSLTSSSGGGGGGCRYESALAAAAAAGVAAAPLKRRRSCSPASVEEIAPLKTENEDDDDEMLMDDGGCDDDEETSGGDAEHTLVIDDGSWEPSDQSGPGGGGDYALGDRGERARSPTASLLGRPRGGCASSSPPLLSRPPISCATLKSLLPSPAPHRSHYTHPPTSQPRPMAVPFPAGLFGRQHDVFPLAVANVVPGVRPPWGRPPMKQLSLLGSSMGPLPDNKGHNPSGGKNSGCVCSNCGTNNTKLWRRNQKGDIVCNACGLYYKLHNVDRPSHLFRDNPMTRRRNPRQPLKRDSGVGSSDDPGHESGGLAPITPPGSSAPPPNSLGAASPPSPSAASDPDSRDELLRLNAAHTLESMSQNFSAKAALVLHQQQHNFQQHLLQQQQQQLIHLHQQRDLQQQRSGGPPPKREIEELSGIEDLYDDAAMDPRGSEVVAMESSSSPRPPPPLLRLHHSPLAPPPRTSSNPPTSSLTADAGDPLSPASSQHAA